MAELRGLKTVLKNLNREATAIMDRTETGLLKAGIVVRNQAMKNTPVKTGKLRASAFGPRPYKQGAERGVKIGFSANYSVVVHERFVEGMNMDIQGKGPKFLERALKSESVRVIGILQREAKIR